MTLYFILLDVFEGVAITLPIVILPTNTFWSGLIWSSLFWRLRCRWGCRRRCKWRYYSYGRIYLKLAVAWDTLRFWLEKSFMFGNFWQKDLSAKWLSVKWFSAKCTCRQNGVGKVICRQNDCRQSVPDPIVIMIRFSIL